MSQIRELINRKVMSDKAALDSIYLGIMSAKRNLEVLQARRDEIARTVQELEGFVNMDETAIQPDMGVSNDDIALSTVRHQHAIEKYNTYGDHAMSHIPDRWGERMISEAAGWLDRMKYHHVNVGLREIVGYANVEWKRYCLSVLNGGKAEADKTFKARFKDNKEGVEEARVYLATLGIEAHTIAGILYEANKRHELAPADC